MSSLDLIVRYLRERSRPLVLVPLAALLAVTGWFLAPDAAASAPRLIAAAAQAFLLILAFRVWDDLEDRGRDAVDHPDRVTVTSGRTLPFVVLAGVLGIAGLAPLVPTNDAIARVIALVAVAATLLVWYRARPMQLARDDSSVTTSRAFGAHLVLIKYPAIALAIAPSMPTVSVRAAATLLSLYLLLCAYESFDDPGLRASSSARRVAITELVVLIPLIIATASFFKGST